MIRPVVIITALLGSALHLPAESLPGFSIEMVAPAEGFLSSIALDEADRIHYTTTDGGIYQVLDGSSREIARVDTAVEGNAALLGMAFAPDGTIVVHYVSSDLRADVVSRLDPETGEEQILARLPCDLGGRECPTEHHGGNPLVVPDGTVFFGIGDYGLVHLARREDLPTSKIFRIRPDGSLDPFAKGFRNPFDLAWDAPHQRLIATDNGAVGDDEIVFVAEGEDHGWPLTMGSMPAVDGMTPPVYVFDGRTAPTGLDLLSGPGWFGDGMLVTSFVKRALYFFPSWNESSISPPIVIIRDETTELIDVRQSATGEIFVASGFAIYRLVPPIPGDVNGDGEVTSADRSALLAELDDATGGLAVHAQDGSVRSSWGADVDENGIIDRRDLAELSRKMSGRGRAVGHRTSAERRRPVSRGEGN